ncbi:hypothetical protein DN594_25230 [Enterobacter cloacae]|uniref:hypothetical protein n=1 Tax=Enterobacter TaxID=547 RepID=UPI000FEBF811|nr:MULTISPECIES: hypothetical protein [Enterobacter]RWS52241.1 hypothetical protein DN594_25230 [Enterobacter cloacae]HBQ7970013.1 hypothetical protein [Klebsiella pneumoniae]MCK6984019.1 hypothetical protein [Enterobacter roggenkampii]MCM7640365.1 hypothetical protein [Enterobacter roggenkampii]MCM7756893.1 hypothetical protein [Enterobacter roggenkampii]
MSTFAIVVDGVVKNLVEWDGESDWAPEEGATVLTDGYVDIGWKFDGKNFTPPTQPEVLAS